MHNLQVLQWLLAATRLFKLAGLCTECKVRRDVVDGNEWRSKIQCLPVFMRTGAFSFSVFINTKL